MKKISTALLLVLVISSYTKTFSQTNLTWMFSGKPEQGFFKKKTTLDGSFIGFNNQNEVAAFCTKLKINPMVVSVQNLGKDAAGNYKITISVKEPNDGKYYAEWLHNLNVAYIQVGDVKKSTEEMSGHKH